MVPFVIQLLYSTAVQVQWVPNLWLKTQIHQWFPSYGMLHAGFHAGFHAGIIT